MSVFGKAGEAAAQYLSKGWLVARWLKARFASARESGWWRRWRARWAQPARCVRGGLGRGKEITVVDVPCLDAWGLFEAGDIAGYLRVVAGHVDQLEATIDVVILAQASTADAKAFVKSDRVVLTSPRAAVESAVRLANTRS